MKIRTKLTLTNLIIILILLGSLTYFFMKRGSEIVFDNVIDNASLSLSQVNLNLDNRMRSYEEIANTLFLNDALQRTLTQSYSDLPEAYQVYFDQYLPFVSAVQVTQNIKSLSIYSENPSFIFSNIILIDEVVRNSEWYLKVIKNPYGSYWASEYFDKYQEEHMFVFRKRLNHWNTLSPMIVSVVINVNILYELISEESKKNRIIFSLADGTTLVDSIKNNKLIRIQELPYFQEIKNGTQGSFAYKKGKESYQVLYQTLNSRNSVRGMKVIMMIPLTQLMPKIDQLRLLSIQLFVIASVVSIICMLAFSVRFTSRISELALKMKRVHKDNFQSFIEVKGNDEMTELEQIFNSMVKRLDQLINEVYLSEIERKEQDLRTKEVELYALQTQINPHFLFNVLNMIRGKLLVSGDRDNATMVGLLAKSFRMMLKSASQTISLSEEIQFVDIYLRLQSYRYGDKFQYNIDITNELLELQVPKLCIQPIVENAITHGIELKKTSSKIWIYGEKVDGKLHIVVEDNGLGISEDRLKEIQMWLEKDERFSKDSQIGMQNVHHRLKYFYGDEYGLKVQSTIDLGTKVTLIVRVQSF